MTINRLNQGTTNQVLVKAISGQTTNLLELQNSSGSVVASIGPTGALGGSLVPPTPPTSGMVLLDTGTFTTVSSVALPDNTFTSTYTNYWIVFQLTAATATANLLLRLRANGSNAGGSSYQSTIAATRVSGGNLSINSQNADAGRIGDINLNAPYPALQFTIFNPQTSGRQTNWSGTGSYRDGSSNYFGAFGGVLDNTTSYDSLAILTSSGNFSGVVSTYGVVK